MAYKNLRPAAIPKKPKTGKTKIKKLYSRVVSKPSYSFIIKCVNKGIPQKKCVEISLDLCKTRTPDHDQAVILKIKDVYRTAVATCNVIEKNPDLWRKTRYRDTPDFWRIAKITEPYDFIRCAHFKRLLEMIWTWGFKPKVRIGVMT